MRGAVPRRVSGKGFNLQVSVTWIATYASTMPREQRLDSWMTSSENRKFSAQFDLGTRYQVHPLRNLPSNTFHQVVGHRLKQISDKNRGGKLPYRILGSATNDFRITAVKVEDFGNNISIARVSADFAIEPGVEVFSALAQARIFRSPYALPEASTGFDAITRYLYGENASAVKVSMRFMMSIGVLEPADSMPGLIERGKKDLVAFHVGAERYALLGADLIEAVQSVSRDLNTKASQEYIILNEQGGTFVHSLNTVNRLHSHRFERIGDLLALGSYFQALLLNSSTESGFPTNLVDGSALARIICYPQNAFHTSYSNRLAWDVISNSLHLRSLLDELERFDDLFVRADGDPE